MSDTSYSRPESLPRPQAGRAWGCCPDVGLSSGLHHREWHLRCCRHRRLVSAVRLTSHRVGDHGVGMLMLAFVFKPLHPEA